MQVEISRTKTFLLLVSQKIGDVPSGSIVTINLLACLLFAPTLDIIEAMASEVCLRERCAGASPDAVAMVWIKSEFDVDAPLGTQKITTQSALLPPLLYLNTPMGNLKPRLLK